MHYVFIQQTLTTPAGICHFHVGSFHEARWKPAHIQIELDLPGLDLVLVIQTHLITQYTRQY